MHSIVIEVLLEAFSIIPHIIKLLMYIILLQEKLSTTKVEPVEEVQSRERLLFTITGVVILETREHYSVPTRIDGLEQTS